VAARELAAADGPPTTVIAMELAALSESVTASLAVMDVTRQLRGRESIVESFLRRFADPGGDGRVHLLHGLGGTGKTSIAAEIARQVSATGATVWWVSAADGASLVSGLNAVARLAGASTEELDTGAAANVLWRRLTARQEPWLLVVDNADDPRILDVTSDGESGTLTSGRGWIRPFLSGPGLVIVTSRRGGDPAQWGNWIVPHPVKMLDPADGAQVLFDHTRGRGGTPPEAQALADRLGGLPLALSLAGSYLAQSVNDPWPDDTAVTTFNDFRAALDQGRTDILQPPADSDDNQPGEQASRLLIDGIWQLTVQLLESRKLPLAGPFMRLLAQFANAPLPYRLILKRGILTSSPIFAELDHDQVRALLQHTAQLGLIDRTSAASTQELTDGDLPVLRVHPLMRDASYRYRDPVHSDDTYLALASRLLVEAVADEPDTSPQDHRRWPIWQLVAPHAFHLLSALSTMPNVEHSLTGQVAHVVDLAARYLFVRGLRSQAKAEYDAMYRNCHHVLGAEHPRTLAARHGMALVLTVGGEHIEAQAELLAVLDARRRILGDEHPETLIARHNMAIELRDRGDFAEAQAEFLAVLDVQRRILGDEHPDTLTTRHSVAHMLQDRRDFAEAQAEFLAVLDVQRRILGDEHPDTLATRHNVASVLRDRGDFAEAQAEFLAVLDVQRRILGDEHPDTLATRHNVASVLQDRRDFAGAQAEFLAVLDLRRRILGDEHPQTLTTRHNLALAYFNAGRRRDAEIEMRAILVIQERILGLKHPSTRTTRDNLKAMKQGGFSTNRPVLWHGPGKRKRKKR
jgi:tetratricopeptide (TPR) repeat protein